MIVHIQNIKHTLLYCHLLLEFYTTLLLFCLLQCWQDHCFEEKLQRQMDIYTIVKCNSKLIVINTYAPIYKRYHLGTILVWGVCTDVSWPMTAWQQWVADSQVYHWLHRLHAPIYASLEFLKHIKDSLETRKGLLGDNELTLGCLGPQTLRMWP